MSSFLNKTNLSLVFCLALTVFINIASFNYYFFQDDWFILNDLKNLNLLTVFIPRTDIIYYRPIGIQSFLLISKSLFGLNYIWYHFVAFGIFLLCICLIYNLVWTLSGKKTLALITALLYGTASFHFMALSWISLTWNYITLAFFLLSLKSLITFQNTKVKKYLVWAFLLFLLCLLSSEFALTIPFFAAGIFLAKESKLNFKSVKYYFKMLLPFFAAIFFYLMFRIFVLPLPAQGVYKPQIGIHILKDYVWYFLWTINLPEMFKYHLRFSNLSLTNEFMDATRDILTKTIFLFFTEAVLIIYCLVKSIRSINKKVAAICITLFLIGLAPVISLPNHSYPYYLTVASIPVIYLLSLVIYNTIRTGNKKLNVTIGGLTLFFWILLSYSNQDFNRRTHWVAAEESVSRKITQNLINGKKITPKIVYIYPSSNLVKLALLNQQAMNLIYGNDVTTVYIQNTKNIINDNNHLFVNWVK